jgi:hypothetical protein
MSRIASNAEENGQPRKKRLGSAKSQGHGQRSLSFTTVGAPSRKFCMKRAPIAVVVTTLTASSRAGRPYSRQREGWGICIVTGDEYAFARRSEIGNLPAGRSLEGTLIPVQHGQKAWPHGS